MMRRVMEGDRMFAYSNVSQLEILVDTVALVLKVEEAQFLPDGRCVITASCLYPRKRIVSFYGELACDPPVYVVGHSVLYLSRGVCAGVYMIEESGSEGLHYAELSDFRDKTVDIGARSGRQVSHRCSSLLRDIYSRIQ